VTERANGENLYQTFGEPRSRNLVQIHGSR